MKFDVACRTVCNATAPHDSMLYTKSAISTNAWCGWVLLSLAEDIVDDGGDGAVWGHLEGPRVELRCHLGKQVSKAGIGIEGISPSPTPPWKFTDTLGKPLTGLEAKGASQSYLDLKM